MDLDNASKLKRDFSNVADDALSGMIDWALAEAHDGRNLSAIAWNGLGRELEREMRRVLPNIAVDDGLMQEFEILLGVTRNLTTVRLVAREIIAVHLKVQAGGSDAEFAATREAIGKRIAWAERNGVDSVGHPSLYHIAAMLTDSQLELEKRRDAVRAAKPRVW